MHNKIILGAAGTGGEILEFQSAENAITGGTSESFNSLSLEDEGLNRHLIIIVSANMTVTPPGCGSFTGATGYTTHVQRNRTSSYDFDMAIASQMDDTGTNEFVSAGWDDIVSASACLLFRVYRNDTNITPVSTDSAASDSLASADLGDYTLIVAGADPGGTSAGEIVLGSGTPIAQDSFSTGGAPSLATRWAIVMNGGTTSCSSTGATSIMRVTWNF